jgi:hypothetical protein
MDKFKKYLQDNKSQLDVENFSADEGWANISKRIAKQKSNTIYFQWGIAASFFILIAGAVYFIYQLKPAGKSSEGIAQINRTTAPVALMDSNIVRKTADTVSLIANNSLNEINKKKGTSTYNKRVVKIQKPELAENEQVEMSFQTVINARLKSIRTTPFYAENPDYFSYFKKEFTQLEIEEKILKTDVKQQGMNDEYLNKLIDIYQGKLSLLKRLQAEVQKMNNRIRQSDPDVDKRKPVYLNI